MTKPGQTTALTPPIFAGQLVQLTADAFDPENQPLTFTWSVVSGPDGGVLTDETTANPRFYSSDVTQNSDMMMPFPEWTLRVEVSDGTNPPVVFNQPVNVRAPRFSNLLNDSVIGSTALTTGCANSTCHGNATHVSGFVINRFNASATHTAMLALHNRGASCTIATRRIQAFNLNGSLLWRKLLGGIPVACGNRMPPGVPSGVPPNELVTIRSWINAGALQN